MPWTESRSREEWLAEVQRRGSRIRRRRRVGFGVVGAFALVLPVSVTATALRSGPERAVEVSVAGPAPAGGVAEPTTTMPIPGGGGSGVLAAVAPEERTPPAGAPSTTTTTEVHQRVASPTGGSVVDATPSRGTPPGADPVGGPTSTAAPAESRPAETKTDAPPAPKVFPIMTLRPCAKSEVKVAVTTDKAVYARGETILGTWTMEKLPGADCRLEGLTSDSVYTRTNFHFETSAGRELGSYIGASNFFAFEVAAEPQKAYSSSFGMSWDQKDCSIALLGVEPSTPSECAQALPGTYALAFEWNGAETDDPSSVGSPHFTGRATFRIGP